jgi:hypothetical protein
VTQSLYSFWSMFSSVDSSLAVVKMCQNLLSQAAFGMILQNHRRLPVCIFRCCLVSEEGYCKDFQISKYFHRSKQKDWISIFLTIRHQSILKITSEDRGSTVPVKENGSSKKLFISRPNPFQQIPYVSAYIILR